MKKVMASSPEGSAPPQSGALAPSGPDVEWRNYVYDVIGCTAALLGHVFILLMGSQLGGLSGSAGVAVALFKVATCLSFLWVVSGAPFGFFRSNGPVLAAYATRITKRLGTQTEPVPPPEGVADAPPQGTVVAEEDLGAASVVKPQTYADVLGGDTSPQQLPSLPQVRFTDSDLFRIPDSYEGHPFLQVGELQLASGSKASRSLRRNDVRKSVYLQGPMILNASIAIVPLIFGLTPSLENCRTIVMIVLKVCDFFISRRDSNSLLAATRAKVVSAAYGFIANRARIEELAWQLRRWESDDVALPDAALMFFLLHTMGVKIGLTIYSVNAWSKTPRFRVTFGPRNWAHRIVLLGDKHGFAGIPFGDMYRLMPEHGAISQLHKILAAGPADMEALGRHTASQRMPAPTTVAVPLSARATGPH